MSLVEKVNITTGVGWAQGLCVGEGSLPIYTPLYLRFRCLLSIVKGNTGPVPGKFPSLCLQDGPLGIRFADHATAWPAGLTAGATWNKELMYARPFLLLFPRPRLTSPAEPVALLTARRHA
jgi:beta-glucosidase